MRKIVCEISYDGTNFSGFQIQPQERTIHGEIEKALEQIHKGRKVEIQASGRTDKGVHARGQVIQFETNLQLPEENWKRALNTLLPLDIVISWVKEVPLSFHVRYHATEKEYRYYVLNEVERDVFKQNYYHHFPYQLDIERIQAACSYLEGEHDFTSFSSAKATIKGSKVRTLTEVTCRQSGNEIEFIFRGNGFLYNMIRIIIGCLLDIGQGRRQPGDIPTLLQKKDRQLLGKTAPPQGLYLWNVTYSDLFTEK